MRTLLWISLAISALLAAVYIESSRRAALRQTSIGWLLDSSAKDWLPGEKYWPKVPEVALAKNATIEGIWVQPETSMTIQHADGERYDVTMSNGGGCIRLQPLNVTATYSQGILTLNDDLLMHYYTFKTSRGVRLVPVQQAARLWKNGREAADGLAWKNNTYERSPESDAWCRKKLLALEKEAGESG